jgi:phosphoribosylamine---glycine ligase
MSSLRKVLVVGSGGREHALAVALLAAPSVAEVVVTPGNAGTSCPPADLAKKSLRNAPGTPLEVARAERPDLVVIGAEAPLCQGLTDELSQAGYLVFGPNRAAAALEGSKAFMKDFADRNGIVTAKYRVVRTLVELDSALGAFSEPPVVKADGLCAGKGVIVSGSHDEARRAALEMLNGVSFGEAGKTVVLEERLAGVEVSVHALCDGERFVLLPAAQDHKRIGTGDTGPNTGGMGTYAPAPILSEDQVRRVEEQIVAPTVRGMAAEGRPFRGALFAGLMVSPAGEPQLLEFNVRFGDPETQVLVSTLEGDFGDALAGAAAGRLVPGAVRASGLSAVCVVLAAAGYPEAPRTGEVIEGLERVSRLPNVRVFHAGTRQVADTIVSAGGRVLGVTATGRTLAEAHARAYDAVRGVAFPGMQYRTDIAARALTSP